MGAIVGASITYRLAFGPNAGRKALTLQTVPVRTEQRKKLERLCRYITRDQPLQRDDCPWPTTATSSSP